MEAFGIRDRTISNICYHSSSSLMAPRVFCHFGVFERVVCGVELGGTLHYFTYRYREVSHSGSSVPTLIRLETDKSTLERR